MVDFASLTLTADTRGLKQGERQLDAITRAGAKAESATSRQTASMSQSYGALAGQMRAAALAAGTVAAALGARAAVGASQTYAKMTNSLRALGMTSEQAAGTLDSIAEVAKRTRAPLDATAQLYQRISIAGKDLGASQEEVLQFTENVGLALAQTGGSASEASGALMQLSQAMAGGVVRAEEFNSILEGAFPIAQAAANGIEGAAGSVGKLRQMVVEGKVSSDAFFTAILSQTGELRKAFENTTPTIGQALTVLGGVFTMMVGEMDTAIGASAGFANVILIVADNMERAVAYAGAAATAFGVYYVGAMVLARAKTMGLVGSLKFLKGAIIRTGIGALVVAAGEMVYWFGRLVKGTGGWGAALELLGEVAVGVWSGIVASAGAIPPALGAVWARVKAAFYDLMAEMNRAWASFLRGFAGSLEGANYNGVLDGAISALEDAADDASKAWGDSTRAAGRAFEEVDAKSKEAAAIVAEGFAAAREAVAKLAAAVSGASDDMAAAGDAATGLNTALAALETGGAAAGDGVADAIAKAREEAKGLAVDMPETISAVEQFGGSMDSLKSTAKGFLSTLKNGLEQGKSIWGAFADAATRALDRVTDQLLDQLLDAIFQVNNASAGGGGGGGIFGAIISGIGGLFGGGGFAPINFPAPAVGGVYAKGGAFMAGREITAFAKGGVIDRAMMAPMALMGEAGPEAILPLSLGPGGKLGVQASGGGTQIQIIDQRGSGEPIEPRRERGPDGREIIRMVVADEIGRGHMDKPMQSRFGARPQRVKY